VRDARGVRAVDAPLGADPAGRVELRVPGATWIVYQSSDDFVELAPAKFRSYLADEGMEYVLALRAARGQVRLPLAAPGEWLVKAVHMVALEGVPEADWQSYWASLTFALPSTNSRRPARKSDSAR
jgi:hypothetical protein